MQLTQLTSLSVNQTITVDNLTLEKQLNSTKISLLEDKLVTINNLLHETASQCEHSTALLTSQDIQMKLKDEMISEMRALLDIAIRKEKELTDEKEQAQKII